MNGMTHLKIENVNLDIKRNSILKDINLSLRDGKIYGLLGRNGAGKTTLLSLIASFRESSAGLVTIDGKVPFENDEMADEVQFSYEYDYSEFTETVEEIIGDYARYKPNYDTDYSDELLKGFRIDKKKVIGELSKGQQAAVNAVTGLATGAEITIFDEVTSGMDAPAREYFYKEVLSMKEHKAGIIILSTHIVSEMDYLFDDVIIIDQGAVLLHEDIDTLLSKGVRVTGSVERVDAFTKNMTVLASETLGPTRSDMVLGTADYDGDDLEFSPIKLQELFIHITEREENHE